MHKLKNQPRHFVGLAAMAKIADISTETLAAHVAAGKVKAIVGTKTGKQLFHVEETIAALRRLTHTAALSA